MSRTGRPSVIKSPVEYVVKACHSPTGITHAEMVLATGLPPRSCSAALYKLRATGKIFAYGLGHDVHYFATEAARDAGQAATHAQLIALKAERVARRAAKLSERDRDAEHKRIKAERKREREALERLERPPKPPAPPKKPKPPKPLKLVLKREPSRDQRERIEWRNATPYIPEHVKVQVLPGYDGDRWKAQIPADGWVQEWNHLRGGAK